MTTELDAFVELEVLRAEFSAWQKAEGLKLTWSDRRKVKLGPYQSAWLCAFERSWNAAVDAFIEAEESK